MSDDEKIEQAIAALTRHRASRAPDLEALLARRQRRLRQLPRPVIAAMATLLLVAMVVLLRENPTPPDGQLVALSNWRAPTDVFLPPPASVIPASVPPLGGTKLTVYTGTPEKETTQ